VSKLCHEWLEIRVAAGTEDLIRGRSDRVVLPEDSHPGGRLEVERFNHRTQCASCYHPVISAKNTAPRRLASATAARQDDAAQPVTTARIHDFLSKQSLCQALDSP